MTKAELKAAISNRHLALLDKEELKSQYYLEKLFAWSEDYSGKTKWEDFKDCWFYCEKCDKYSERCDCT